MQVGQTSPNASIKQEWNLYTLSWLLFTKCHWKKKKKSFHWFLLILQLLWPLQSRTTNTFWSPARKYYCQVHLFSKIKYWSRDLCGQAYFTKESHHQIRMPAGTFPFITCKRKQNYWVSLMTATSLKAKMITFFFFAVAITEATSSSQLAAISKVFQAPKAREPTALGTKLK